MKQALGKLSATENIRYQDIVKVSEIHRTISLFLGSVVLGIPLFIATAVTAQARRPIAGTYTWGAEVVSVDRAAGTLTVRAKVTGIQPIMELPKFKPGDRLLLTWAVQSALNGPDRYGDAIIHTVLYDSRKKLEEPFTFATELVAFDPVNRSVVFKIAVAPDTIDIKSLNPGQWLVATSPIIQASSSEFVSVQFPVRPSQFTGEHT